MDKQPEILATSREAYDLLRLGLQGEKGVHAGTLVSAAARLAGASLQRTFKLDLAGVAPGTVVLSEQANQEWPKLTALLLGFLRTNGIVVDDKKAVFKTPEVHQSRKDFCTIITKFQPGYDAIAAKHGLDDLRAAKAATLACAMIIRETSKVVDPHISCGIAALGLVEGARTVPPPKA